MPFGLTNAPAFFQALMNKSFSDFLDVFAAIHLDDILIYSTTREEHVEHVRQVLQRMRELSLYAKSSKCEFFESDLSFLGFRVGRDSVSMG